MSKCKGCGADLRWISTKTGKAMPCDAKAVRYWRNDKGKQLVVLLNGEVVRCDLTGDQNEVTGEGYIPHWATCPFSKKFKEGKA